MRTILKKIYSVALLLILTLISYAPGSGSLTIIDVTPDEPFKELIYAIGKVETNHDTLAYNPLEESVGYFQIRPVRVSDYNMRTGSNYILKDMFDYKTSEKVFLYYASQIGPYNFKKIAMNWNGSGPRTIQYWNRVKKYL
jgi:hypothetical protein